MKQTRIIPVAVPANSANRFHIRRTAGYIQSQTDRTFLFWETVSESGR